MSGRMLNTSVGSAWYQAGVLPAASDAATSSAKADGDAIA